MKNLFLILTALFFALNLTACKKKEKTPTPEEIITEGRWRYYKIKEYPGGYENQFNTYAEFAENGTLTIYASDGSTVIISRPWSLNADTNPMILTIGDKDHYIDKLNEKELIFDEETSIGFNKHYMKKP